ncbi:NAD(P)-binding protein [Pisolithus croceorrhizus]|nr:NAD(P)-binding protein [Pisolithus croceorrhizus]
MDRPIIIVTGANSGVGFGICHRLLVQLSSNYCEDAHPKYPFHGLSSSAEFQVPCDGLTLILACRSRQRAEEAKSQLYKLLDKHISQLRKSPHYDGCADKFRQNLVIAIHLIDLASVRSVFDFADGVTQTYPYVSHLICNAGVVCFTKIDWLLCLEQVAKDFMGAMTVPKFFSQSSGRVSADGLGWLWQCNVFGHYVLFRALEPHLSKYKGSIGARVIWVSSHEATSEFYNPEDWQLINDNHSYQSSKYQVNLLALRLDREATKHRVPGMPVVRHFSVLPGIVATNIANVMLGPIMTVCMMMAFYIVSGGARFLGSPSHLRSAFEAAVSAVHLALVPLVYLPALQLVENPDTKTKASEPAQIGTLYMSQTDRWGTEYVGTLKFVESRAEDTHVKELLAHCDDLLETFCTAQRRKSASG